MDDAFFHDIELGLSILHSNLENLKLWLINVFNILCFRIEIND